ncbi:class V chitinase, putative [Trichophyton verrucosum HKI 0517]|uniref:chitinase n=1 Tax=Trichophyton verrucosum (strain HKI 0517) TaxID=663202 RepID=D4DJB0_TRIVH|nr:class V chitinase, putative [Trichophyton verrucosum HKI 0517]EFE38061.1 class V chitinase, putative [Trichophyton verrucosum HKI 0517]
MSIHHLNYAFATINSDHTLGTTGYYADEFYRAFTNLKTKKPSLKCFLSVGGWDAGGKVFSVMASSAASRKVFIDSVIKTLEMYGFDGLDIDWEYPVADDRGNFSILIALLTVALKFVKLTNLLIGYLRGFDLKNMVKYVDWFNVMSYDIHGTWDGHSEWTKEVINPHTNLTGKTMRHYSQTFSNARINSLTAEISAGLDLLWRNSVPPGKVLLGLGFYGRSFTLGDPRCNSPGCSFKRTGDENSGGARPGRCTLNSGTLSNYEINRILKSKSPELVYNDEAGVNWITWDSDQWVSFDDARTLKQKASFANNLCLGGTFAWALDLGGPGTMSRPDELNGNTLSLDGADLEGGDSGSGDVYISPEIYKVDKPGIACIPPCTFIMPRLTLDEVTTITFPPYTTSLEVLWWTAQAITLPGGAISSSIGYIFNNTRSNQQHFTTPVLITNSVPAGAVAPPQNTGSGHQAGQPEVPHSGQPIHGGNQPTQTGGQLTQGAAQPSRGGSQLTQEGGQLTHESDQPTQRGGQPTQDNGQSINNNGQASRGGVQLSNNGQPTQGDSRPTPGRRPDTSTTEDLLSRESSEVAKNTFGRHTTQPNPNPHNNPTSSPGDRQSTPSNTGHASERPTTGAPPRISDKATNNPTNDHNSHPTSNQQSDFSTDIVIIPFPGGKVSRKGGNFPTPPPGSRMFTPKPYPLSSVRDNGKLPTVSFTSGPPSPTCTKDCGRKCQGAFCDCKDKDCTNHGKDFIDPNDPDPPKDLDRRKCIGPQCEDGNCKPGNLCSNFDCVGPDCHDGICLGPNCARLPCVGENCLPGCKGPRCKSPGCIGECNDDGECIGSHCMNFGCTGADCLPPCLGCPPVCKGPRCRAFKCQGKGCKNGFCTGSGCKQDTDDCERPDTAPRCTESIYKFKRSESVFSSTTKTKCSTVTACSVEETTVTKSTTIDKGKILTISEHYPVHTLLSDEKYQSIANSIHAAQVKRDKSRFGPTSTTKEEPSRTVTVTLPPTFTTAHVQDKGDLLCDNDGNGVADRKELILGINFFCRKYDRYKFAGDEVGVWKDRTSPAVIVRGDCSKGKCKSYVTFRIGREKDHKDCPGDFVVSGRGDVDDQCGQNFRQIVDRCHTSGENHKGGGHFTTKCETWSINIRTNSYQEYKKEQWKKTLKVNHAPPDLHDPQWDDYFPGVVGEPPQDT